MSQDNGPTAAREVLVLRASKNTSPGSLAGAISGQLREWRQAIVDAVGPLAINITVKALIYARNYMEAEGKDLYYYTVYHTVALDPEKDGTATRFVIEVD